MDIFLYYLERWQGLLLVPFLVGLILLVLGYAQVGLALTGTSMAISGLPPLLSGRYTSRLVRLTGIAARFRGLISVAIGVFLLVTAWGL